MLSIVKYMHKEKLQKMRTVYATPTVYIVTFDEEVVYTADHIFESGDDAGFDIFD